MTSGGDEGTVSMVRQFRRRFWLPPRPHGEVVDDRTVSFLELFYDLVYVVVIARAAHTLAEHITWRSVWDFVVIFGLIWFAWLNGSLYYDLHGREDGRTRMFVFVQMLLLAVLAVFAGSAGGDGGRAFAVVYALYLAVLSWLWYSVRREDAEEYDRITKRYLAGMIVSLVIVGVSTLLPDEMRIAAWAVVIIGWIVGIRHMSDPTDTSPGLVATSSMVERWGLLVIIVLGEVVAGVVNGLSESDQTFRAIVTGLLGLMVGFAYWWTYFDFVGRRIPRPDRRSVTTWMTAHLPVTMAIAGAGAAMVSLIEHADDSTTPRPTAWLLSGSVVVGLIALVVVMRTLVDFDRFPSLFRPVAAAMVGVSAIAICLGSLAPAPWMLALGLVVILSGLWFFAVARWLVLDDPDEAVPHSPGS